MNVASPELCGELYGLSDWDDTDGELSPKGHYWPRGEFLKFHSGATQQQIDAILPAYDLGYLLRKLPHGAYLSKGKTTYTASTGNYRSGQYGFPVNERSDTPENAVCLLVIELFKQDILTKGSAK